MIGIKITFKKKALLRKCSEMKKIMEKVINFLDNYGKELARSIKETEFTPGAHTWHDMTVGIRSGKLYRSIKSDIPHVIGNQVFIKVGSNVKYTNFVRAKKPFDFLKRGFIKFDRKKPLPKEVYKIIYDAWSSKK